MRMWERKLALCIAAVCILIGLWMFMTKADKQPIKVERFYFSDPLCPTGIWVAQRHDKRDRWGIIVERKWKRVCAV